MVVSLHQISQLNRCGIVAFLENVHALPAPRLTRDHSLIDMFRSRKENEVSVVCVPLVRLLANARLEMITL